ncbi:class I SAM-dependent methyltransferase [Fulvimarina sp. MAC8]|uniref:class I SAM-dependent DNA methyltransferase n=1 Tax=Fulvimarina sp. MAC8 TaxID=3162874 RepID=UPI0032EECE06
MVEHARQYDHWAWLYNATLGPRYGQSKIGPLARVILPDLPQGGAILDLCCGTGQLAAILTQRGFSVTGVDGSPDMLRHARENAPEAEFIEADCRNFTVRSKYDGVICASASLNHMRTAEDLRGVFTSVNHALKVGGPFVFDVNHPGQMARHWRGSATEGETLPEYAWSITPHYDVATASGAFTVEIYQRAGAGSTLADLADKLSQKGLLRRWRLSRLRRYAAIRPEWKLNAVTNSVWGHDIDFLTSLLGECGFSADVRSTTGGAVDDDHGVYLLCRKVEELDQAIVGADREGALS